MNMKEVGDLSLKGRVGVLVDSESDSRRQIVLPSILESIKTQPAQPPSGRIAHLFASFANTSRFLEENDRRIFTGIEN
jgi:hypothetical protein